jgi:predicted cupin superfamily sugar epimerase
MAAVKAQQLIRDLGLVPLEGEGGYYRKIYTHRSGSRILGGTIYYLVDKDNYSRLHWLPTDEVWYFLEGSPLRQLVLYPDGRHSFTMLGFASDGRKPIAIVPGGCWQGTKLEEADGYALCATTMVPPYDPSRYRQGSNDLFSSYPDCPEIEEYLR